MSPEVKKTIQAFHDLDAIATFIGMDNPQAAIHFLDCLEERFQLLTSSPGIGRPRPDFGHDIRSFPVEDYIIFYRPADSGVEVVRVLHGAQDIESLFRDSSAG